MSFGARFDFTNAQYIITRKIDRNACVSCMQILNTECSAFVDQKKFETGERGDGFKLCVTSLWTTALWGLLRFVEPERSDRRTSGDESNGLGGRVRDLATGRALAAKMAQSLSFERLFSPLGLPQRLRILS